MTRRSVTARYPEEAPELHPRTRGVIGLFEENCTVCMLCARECPDWCIYIDSHKETVPATTPGGRDRSRNVLDRFAIDFALCMYCGICIEVCPFDALFWSPEFEYAEEDIRDLTHERDRLREWMWTVPAPPALDPGAGEPKEAAAARKVTQKHTMGEVTRTSTDGGPPVGPQPSVSPRRPGGEADGRALGQDPLAQDPPEPKDTERRSARDPLAQDSPTPPGKDPSPPEGRA